jgi:hypothetical protein
MLKETFNKIVENILHPCLVCASKKQGIVYIDVKPCFEVESTFCSLVYKKYEKERAKFHASYMVDKKTEIDRHKISAIFYVAFVEAATERKFVDFKKILGKEHKFLFVHNLAFNISMSILESFIISAAKKDKKYCEHLKAKGIMTELREYKEYTIKEFILTHKHGKLSPLLLANIFYSIERKSEEKFLRMRR